MSGPVTNAVLSDRLTAVENAVATLMEVTERQIVTLDAILHALNVVGEQQQWTTDTIKSFASVAEAMASGSKSGPMGRIMSMLMPPGMLNILPKTVDPEGNKP